MVYFVVYMQVRADVAYSFDTNQSSTAEIMKTLKIIEHQQNIIARRIESGNKSEIDKISAMSTHLLSELSKIKEEAAPSSAFLEWMEWKNGDRAISNPSNNEKHRRSYNSVLMRRRSKSNDAYKSRNLISGKVATNFLTDDYIDGECNSGRLKQSRDSSSEIKHEFESRLSESVNKYFNKTKRDSLEVRNYER